MKENEIIQNYLKQNNLDDLPISKESAIRISRQVANDFNVDLNSFKVLKMDDRPFLREDTGFLLTHKEGLCGEGARVIVRILNAQGFDAARITLYDRYMQFAHTIVSVQQDEESYWVDTINSQDSLTMLLERENISEDNFKYLSYSDKISQRLQKIEEHRDYKNVDFQKFLGEYFLYSYESIPYTKLLSKIGIKKRVFNLERPPQFVSALAEMPNMIMFIFCFCLSLIITIFSRLVLRRLNPKVLMLKK